MATANIANTKIVPIETTLKPYYDDFDETKNFHRILFRPGYAVQARELTQLQTILQSQIERFGNHIFQNGSLVLGGASSIDFTATHINLQSTYANTSIVAGSFTGNNITLSSGNAAVKAYVFGATEATTADPPVLVVKYFTGQEFTATSIIKSESNVYANVATTNATGPSTIASINDGIFFINGYFVKVPAQTVVVDKFSTQANAKVGLEYTTEIITESDDASLLDPAQEASNYQAPGASRLRINFDLTTRALNSVDDAQFVELIRLENGVIKKQIQYPVYSVLGETLARRTYDESGHYTVRRFGLSLVDHPTDNTKFQVVLDPGKAYIKGFEYENISQEKLTVDKGRTTQTANNRDIYINYGNNLYIANLKGYIDTTNMERVDMHSVTTDNINFTSAAAYAQTKIGSARTRELKYFYSPSTANANTTVYTLSLFDTQFSNILVNTALSSITANTFAVTDTYNKLSSVNNAYSGATVRVITGTGVGERHTISTYNAVTKTFTLADPFITQPAASSNLSIDLTTKTIESVVKHISYTGGATGNANSVVYPLSKVNGVDSGDTYFTDPVYNKLIFPMAESYIKKGSLTNQTFQYNYFDTNPKSFTANLATFTLSSGLTFGLPNGNNSGTSTTTLQNFGAFRSTGGFGPGERLNFSWVSVNNSGTPQVQAYNSDNFNGSGYFYYTVNVNSGASSLAKVKTLRTGNTSNFTSSAASGTFISNLAYATTNTSVYLASGEGQAIIRNPSNNPDDRMSLFTSDVIKITKIYDLAGATPAAGASITGYTDVTSRYNFDNGQRDSRYDHATIYPKSRNSTTAGPLLVCFNYYDHGADAGGTAYGYFSVDSYPNYEDIPTYVSSDGSEINLRDAIDFRPKRLNASNTSPNYTLEGVRVPVSTTSFRTSYQYYLGRKANIILTTDFGNPFKVVDGIPSVNPVEPRITDPDNSMLLYKLSIEPYTFTTSNVAVTFVDNKRYTMRDIGKLERRIENLEYYQTLSILEKTADSMKVLDANGLERTKYGIIADDFTTHGYGSVNDSDYLIAIDRVVGGAMPAQNVVSMPLPTVSNNSVYVRGSATILQYTEEPMITQNLATKWVAVQPYMLAQYVGKIHMTPPDDMWTEVSQAPDVIINLGENDAIASANTIIRDKNRRSTRADFYRANNAMVTEAFWWMTHFGHQ